MFQEREVKAQTSGGPITKVKAETDEGDGEGSGYSKEKKGEQ